MFLRILIYYLNITIKNERAVFFRMFVSRCVQDGFGHGEGEAERVLTQWLKNIVQTQQR